MPALWIMIAGPYSAGGANANQRAANLRALNQAAARLFAAGHVPIIGVNLALPMIDADGGADAHDRIMMPLSLALTDRCDACLRIGGPSAGADREAERFKAAGKPVYTAIGEIPPPTD